MSAKALLPNQHTLLHEYYGQRDCCLCVAESRIGELEDRVKQLEDKLPHKPSEPDIPRFSKEKGEYMPNKYKDGKKEEGDGITYWCDSSTERERSR